MRQDIIRQFLLAEAERVGGEYVALAEQLKARFIQLAGLDGLLKRVGGHKRGLLARNWEETLLPTFQLNACEGMGYRSEPHILFSANHEGYRDTFTNAREAEAQRLRGYGIALV